MKKIFKSILAAALLAPALTGCIEEVFPTNGIVQEQLEASSKATEALLWAMPAHLNQVFTVAGNQHFDWGYGSVMHVRDVMTADMPIVSSNYNHYTAWINNTYGVSQDYQTMYFLWMWHCEQILTANNLIRAIDADTDDDLLRYYLGCGYAFRAFTYLDMARVYEFLPNDAVSPVLDNGNNVTRLTVPIVTETTTEEEARNNPRATHEEMFDFIKSDLDKAISYFSNNSTSRPGKTVPDLAVAYGLMCRAMMWNENYEEGQKYARLAIDTFGGRPMNESEWLSTTTGFNDLNNEAWMWGMQFVSEDGAVQTGIINWTSWMSNETSFGYASAGPFVMIGADLYDHISDRDFRKLAFIAPEGSSLSGREPVIDKEFAEENLKPYYSLKFRPGAGNMQEASVACAVGVPMMRVEEMYFNEAECAAHQNAASGKTLLEKFMRDHRYSSYNCRVSGTDDVVEEIVTQKRIELFGEGLSFFDIKRLNMSVTRNYNGSNFNYGSDDYNTNGRPAWMNWQISRQEADNNKALKEWNNPSPANAYSSVSGGA